MALFERCKQEFMPIKKLSLYMKNGELQELKLISWTAMTSRW